MKQIQASQAKAQFAELLDQVERGETVVITRHGKPIARLVRENDERRADALRAMAEIKELRKTAGRATVEEILAWRDEGRKIVVPFVLDASVVGCWCFQDEHDARADAAWDLLERDRESALVPLQWWFEIRNVTLHGERRRRLTEDYTSRFFRILERFAIDYAALPDHAAVMTLARGTG